MTDDTSVELQPADRYDELLAALSSATNLDKDTIDAALRRTGNRRYAEFEGEGDTIPAVIRRIVDTLASQGELADFVEAVRASSPGQPGTPNRNPKLGAISGQDVEVVEAYLLERRLPGDEVTPATSATGAATAKQPPPTTSSWKGRTAMIAIGAGAVILLLIVVAAFWTGSGDPRATDRGEITVGESQRSEIERESQRDDWTLIVDGAPREVRVIVAAVAGSALDPSFKVTDPDSTVIVDKDDSGDGGSEQATVRLPIDGNYIIEVTAWRFSSTGEYEIIVSES